MVSGSWMNQITHKFPFSVLRELHFRYLKEQARRYFESVPARAQVLRDVARSKSTGASYFDYLLLHSYIRQYKPRLILELGSGVTSVIMAQALSEIEDGIDRKIVSMEDLPEYHKDAKSLMSPHLAKYVDYQLSPKVEVESEFGLWGFHYKDVPDHAYDFVFVDGPNDVKDGKQGVDLDVFHVLKRQPHHPVDVIIDGRQTTARALAGFFAEGRLVRDERHDAGLARALRGVEMAETRREVRLLPQASCHDFFNLQLNA